MSPFPRDPSFDSTVALLSEGYTFISRRCQRYQSDVFETRLMLTKAICTVGEEAARMFYVPDRFTRKGALPKMTLMLLQDLGSAQVLDGEAHRHRKQMFLSMLSPAHNPDGMRRLSEITADEWRAAVGSWKQQGRVVLLDSVQEVLCRAVCRWAGVPLPEAEVLQRTREFAAMVDGAGAVGPRNWRGHVLRTRTERWVRDMIDQIRAGTVEATAGSAAHTIAWHREPDGQLLDTGVAAVELINVLRPVVAVSYYVTFAAQALHAYPECRPRLEAGDEAYLEGFVQEVRRFYPFFPFVGGRVQQPFDWRDYHFAPGTWVLLDLYGTNHDPRIWEEPARFRPERFGRWDENAYSFVPQGGGDHALNHRCAGEWITIDLVKTAVRLLTTEMRYQVPAQDLRIRLSRMPALPESRFVIEGVRSA